MEKAASLFKTVNFEPMDRAELFLSMTPHLKNILVTVHYGLQIVHYITITVPTSLMYNA